MSIDERLEFLLQSTESLHASIGELHTTVAGLQVVVREHTKQLEIDAENIRSLARIAESHQQRLDDLDDAGVS